MYRNFAMTSEQRANIQRYLKSKNNGRYRRHIESEKVKCEKCGSTSDLEWHHKILFSEGGDDSPENLAVLCNSCHQLSHKHNGDYRKNGRWGGLVSAYLREQKLGRKKFCEEMRILAKKRKNA